jgi:single-strand DNA-binding protein
MSFKMIAVGRLTGTPALTEKDVCSFSLISDDYRGPNKPKEPTTVFFVAFNSVAKAIASHCLSGDQLIVFARHESNNFLHHGETVYRYQNVVEEFQFGAPGRESRAQLVDGCA